MTTAKAVTSNRYLYAKVRYDALTEDERGELVCSVAATYFEGSLCHSHSIRWFFGRQADALRQARYTGDADRYEAEVLRFIQDAQAEEEHVSMLDMVRAFNAASRHAPGSPVLFGVAFVMMRAAWTCLVQMPDMEDAEMVDSIIHFLSIMELGGNDLRQRAEIFALLVPPEPEQPA